MNHWFLCGRDLMWLAICSAPIFLALAAGYWAEKTQHLSEWDQKGHGWFALAVVWQGFLLICLYTGMVK